MFGNSVSKILRRLALHEFSPKGVGLDRLQTGGDKTQKAEEGRGCRWVVAALYPLFSGKPLEPWPLGGTTSSAIARHQPSVRRCPGAFRGEYSWSARLPEPVGVANPTLLSNESSMFPAPKRGQRPAPPQVEGICQFLGP